jgi:hypothetical protein
MTFEDFNLLDFPPAQGTFHGSSGGFVYVFCWVADGLEIPFYVGQTNRFSGRMRDYDLANFKACTDFCVGEAAKYLKSVKNYRVTVRHKPSPDPPLEEKAIIRSLLVSGIWLLNCLPRYDYRTDSEARERELVRRFCDMFTANHRGAPNGK